MKNLPEIYVWIRKSSGSGAMEPDPGIFSKAFLYRCGTGEIQQILLVTGEVVNELLWIIWVVGFLTSNRALEFGADAERRALRRVVRLLGRGGGLHCGSAAVMCDVYFRRAYSIDLLMSKMM